VPFKKLKYYEKITGMSKVGRRYLVMSTFDSVLAILGILLGSYFAGVSDSSLVVAIGVGAAVAIGISGLWSAFLVELAEQNREMKELERALHRDLTHTDLKKAHDFAAVAIALTNSISPLVASLLVLLPFIILSWNAVYSITVAYYLSVALAFIIFFILGTFLAKVSKENIMLTGLKMASAGIICILILYFLKLK
jgi:predicted membrane protein (TIGR00267 family)